MAEKLSIKNNLPDPIMLCTIGNTMGIEFNNVNESEGEKATGQTGGGWREEIRKKVLFWTGEIKPDLEELRDNWDKARSKKKEKNPKQGD